MLKKNNNTIYKSEKKRGNGIGNSGKEGIYKNNQPEKFSMN